MEKVMEKVMEEEEQTAGGGADLLMEYDDEEQKVCLRSPQRDEEEEKEGDDEAPQPAAGPTEEQESDPPPVRIIPIPVQPVSSCSPPPHRDTENTVKCPGAPLGFMVNGWLVSLLHGGGGAVLKLHSHPRGSASGFTTVQIPVTPSVRSPAGTEHVNTSSSPTPTSVPAAPGPEADPDPDPTPIITGVVSGEAAQRVLSDHRVNFKSSPPLRQTPNPLQTTPAAPPSRRPAPLKLLRKGRLGPAPPPDCPVCTSPYKLITELRGFMCLCSPVIVQSLKNLKKKNALRRRSRDKSKTSKTSRVSKTRPGLSASKVVSPSQRTHRPPEDFLSNQFTGTTARPASCSSQQDPSEPPPDPPHGKLVIMVEDFYYGFAPGRSAAEHNAPNEKFTGLYRCIHCPKTLRNNIRLMSHMQQHVSTMSKLDGRTKSPSTCPHCFRHFMCPFKLQCHLEAVHSQYESTAKCKICELQFGSEPAFLWHMKSSHKPGEMPYVCQVCDFRSSFHSDVLFHFKQLHADTKHLLCHYCLRVLRSSTSYQQHFARHQKKNVFSCDQCRLHFLYVRERIEHKQLHHRTHIRPPQLTGLKPGTKVTVRTYSVVREPQKEDKPMKSAPCKVVVVDPPPPRQEARKRKPVQSLGSLLSALSQESEAAGVSRPSQRCVECLSSFQDFGTHFPSLVHCSLCRFITCCSMSYANHMINNHATCRKKPHYHSVFQSQPRLADRLMCVSCTFSTYRGDEMANHLTERPKHRCIMLTHTEPRVNGHLSSSVTSSVSWGGGAFIPIHLLPSCQTSTQLSVKSLTSPSPLSSPPAMTIKFLGPRPQPERGPGSPLSASQLSVVVFALCHGVSQAARRYQTSPLTVRSWIRQQERRLSDRKWSWRTEKSAEWLLSRREQQLSVSEDVLLQTARTALGEDSELKERYSWTVDFMLRHELSLQPVDTRHHRGRLPRTVRDDSRSFIRALSAQIQSRRVPPHRVASMDEFSIFVDSDLFSDQDPSALRLFGSSEDEPAFDVVLAALSDGTFLPPLLFFRGTPSHLPEGFPENVLLEARQGGFTDQDRLQIWINEVWRPRVSSLHHSESVLMVDVHRGHLADEFRDSLTSVSTDVVFIPSGCSCRLQPLDVCVTPVLRDFLQARWTQLVSQGGLDGLGLDQLALTLACWLSEVSSTLNTETRVLRRSFAAACNLQQLEDRGEAVRMIRALSQALVQPAETSGPPPEPGPELELLLMEEQPGEEELKEEAELQSPSALCRVFDCDSDEDSFDGFQDD